MGIAVGIDLGTTNTVVGVVVDGLATTLEDEHHRRLIPSIVSFHPSGSVLVGDLARERRVVDPSNTVYSVKRLIGRPFASPEVQEARLRFPFELLAGPKDSTLLKVRGNTYALPELSAFVLRRAKKISEDAIGNVVDRAVITVPANFNELQRASTKVAGRLAGLDVLRILNEPTAAALAYGQELSGAETIAVFDLGGGTFDITVLDMNGDVFEVRSTAGDTALGGDDIDTRLADVLADRFLQAHGYDPRTFAPDFARLRLVAEELKCDVSTKLRASRVVEGLGPREGISFMAELTRAEVEEVAAPIVERAIEVTRNVLSSAGLAPKDLNQVILVGGSTRMPLVAQAVGALFQQEPTCRINPDEVVALGASIQANSLQRKSQRPHALLGRSMIERVAMSDNQPGSRGTLRPPVHSNAPNAMGLPVVEAPPPSAAVLPPMDLEGGRTQMMAAMEMPVDGDVSPARKVTAPGLPVVNPDGPRKAPSFGKTPAAAPSSAGKLAAATGSASKVPAATPGSASKVPAATPGSAGKYPASVPIGAISPISRKTAVQYRPGPAKEVEGVSAKRSQAPAPEAPPTREALVSRKTPPLGSVSPPAGNENRVVQELPAMNMPRRQPTLTFDVPSSPDDGDDATAISHVPTRPEKPKPQTSSSPDDTAKVPSVSAFAATEALDAYEIPDFDLSLPEPASSSSMQVADNELESVRDLVRAGATPLDIPDIAAHPGFDADNRIRVREASALLVDVTPLSLRVETVAGYSEPLIASNTAIPCDQTRVFYTARDNQTRVSVRVAQGESSRFSENTYLGEVELDGIEPGRRGEVRISVTFELDVDGLLNVRATDLQSNREARATLKLFGANTEAAEVEAMARRQAQTQVMG